MKTVLILGILILPATLSAMDFTDNFNLYTPGNDLDVSSFWYKPDSCGSLTVINDGGNMIVETAWNGYNSLAYICLGSEVVLDGEIEADIKYTGLEASCGLLARVNSATGEGYIGYIYSAFPGIGVTFIAYIDGNGNYTTLESDYYYPFNEDSWYTVSFQVTGSNPVELSISVNGSVSSTFQDSIYDLGEGMTGLGSRYTSGSAVYSVDNFAVTDYASALTAVTFGGIKALFK
ncbi:MAG: hypothetical protein KAH54_01915 [Candidatus Sabulitectum sp.]|nr:hypothetical protein [Candidatus Sabulitectum sp.]